MKNKQTAVEWLIEQLQAPCRGIPSHIIEEAKQMEKEQIMDDFMAGKWDWQEHLDTGNHLTDPAIYYRKTYGK